VEEAFGQWRAEVPAVSGSLGWVGRRFAAFAVLYGIVETMNGNWASLFMANDLGSTTTLAAQPTYGDRRRKPCAAVLQSAMSSPHERKITLPIEGQLTLRPRRDRRRCYTGG
jgi:hypothetical protein